MGRNTAVPPTGGRRLVLLAVLTLTFAACAESAYTPYAGGEEFELTVSQASWKGRIIGLVNLPRQYHHWDSISPEDAFTAVSPGDAAEMPEGRCVALLGELTILEESFGYPDLLNLPAFELPDLPGGGRLDAATGKCDTAEVLSAGYGFLGFASHLSTDETYHFFEPYYIEGEITGSAAVSVSSWYEENERRFEAPLLSSPPRVVRRTFARPASIGEGDSTPAEFSYTKTWGTNTLTWSGRIEGIIEIDVRSDAFLIETAGEWVHPSNRCIAVVGSETLPTEAERSELLGMTPYMAWLSIGLVVDERFISRSGNFQCLSYIFPYTVDPNFVERFRARFVSEDIGLLAVFLVPPEAEIEGVVTDPWGDETAFYEAVLIDL